MKGRLKETIVKHRLTTPILALGVLTLAATVSAQHPRSISKGSADLTAPVRPINAPQATIGGSANGLYCPDMSDQAVGMHDLGWIPAGRNVVVVVQAIVPTGFD